MSSVLCAQVFRLPKIVTFSSRKRVHVWVLFGPVLRGAHRVVDWGSGSSLGPSSPGCVCDDPSGALWGHDRDPRGAAPGARPRRAHPRVRTQWACVWLVGPPATSVRGNVPSEGVASAGAGWALRGAPGPSGPEKGLFAHPRRRPRAGRAVAHGGRPRAGEGGMKGASAAAAVRYPGRSGAHARREGGGGRARPAVLGVLAPLAVRAPPLTPSPRRAREAHVCPARLGRCRRGPGGREGLGPPGWTPRRGPPSGVGGGEVGVRGGDTTPLSGGEAGRWRQRVPLTYPSFPRPSRHRKDP